MRTDECKVKYVLRRGILFKVLECVADTKKTFYLILAGLGLRVLRKNGKDGLLFNHRPYGWGVIGED